MLDSSGLSVSSRLIRIATGIFLTFGLAIPAMAANSCSSQEVELREAHTAFERPGGTREIASVGTRVGHLVTQVTVSGKKTSAPMFYLRGEAMKKTSKSSLPKNVRACVQKESRSSKGKGSHQQKRKRKPTMEVWVFCDDLAHRCIAVACIGNSCGVGAASY